MGLTHLSLGFCLFRVLEETEVMNLGILNLCFLLFGTLLPDIDMPFSLIGRIFKPISFRIREKVGHRTATHSLFALGHLLLIYLLSLNKNFLMLLIGCTSHLCLDLLNKTGVKLLWPLEPYFVILDGRIEAGGKYDYLFLILFSFLSGAPHLIFYPLKALK